MNIEECTGWILRHVRELVHPSIEVDTRLLDEGLLDSFLAVQLIGEIEQEFSISIELVEASNDDLATVQALASFVLRSQTSSILEVAKV